MELIKPEEDNFECAVEFVMLPVTVEIMRKSVNRLTSLFPRKSVLRTKISPGYTKTIYRVDGQLVFKMSFDKRTFCGRPVYDKKEASGPDPSVKAEVDRLGLEAVVDLKWEAVKLRMEQTD